MNSTWQKDGGVTDNTKDEESKRIIGKWVYDSWNDSYVCSACGYSYEIDSEDDIKEVCPLCGLDMEIS